MQFSLRGLLVATLALGVGWGLLVRWWRTPVFERSQFMNGIIERVSRRNLVGALVPVREVHYYSSGAKACEFVGGKLEARLPDGTVINARLLEYALLLDNGDGTFEWWQWDRRFGSRDSSEWQPGGIFDPDDADVPGRPAVKPWAKMLQPSPKSAAE